MSHDRGCPCGREKYEYDDCTRANCTRTIRRYTAEDWAAESIENRLSIAARASSASLEHCKLMDEGSDEIIKLRSEIATLKRDNAELQRFYEKYGAPDE